MVFQGMRALKTYGDRKSDISKVSRNVAKTVTVTPGMQSTQSLENKQDTLRNRPVMTHTVKRQMGEMGRHRVVIGW
jgi:hypothetical protein